jgi:predicted Zn-dependent protease
MRKALILAALFALAVAGNAPAQGAGEVATTPEVAAAIDAADNLMKAEQWPEAVAAYEKLLAQLPDSGSLKLSLGRAYYGAGELKKAIAQLSEVYKADSGNAVAAAQLASMLAEDGQIPQARKILEPLPADSLADPIEVINVGLIFMNKNVAKDAWWYFDKAVKTSPKSPAAYYYRALASLQLGKGDAGKADLNKVIEVAPDSDEAKDAKELLEELKAGT